MTGVVTGHAVPTSVITGIVEFSPASWAQWMPRYLRWSSGSSTRHRHSRHHTWGWSSSTRHRHSRHHTWHTGHSWNGARNYAGRNSKRSWNGRSSRAGDSFAHNRYRSVLRYDLAQSTISQEEEERRDQSNYQSVQ